MGTSVWMTATFASHFLLLSNAICSASFTAVHKFIREVPGSWRSVSVLVTNPLKAIAHLCLLKAERARPAASMLTERLDTKAQLAINLD